ncbi:Wzy polymerase domain-containing protein [Thermomonas sp.]|uniref:PglL family O-oligosaccharyltransferase n=1 Tax=Thermomonas sp. TaxID=1971895 RepID=UPI00321FD12D
MLRVDPSDAFGFLSMMRQQARQAVESAAGPRVAELAGVLGLLLVGLAWLVPNKEWPWPSFWNEASAGAAMLLLACAAWGASCRTDRPLAVRTAWLALVVLGVASVWIQRTAGLLMYGGDAWLVTLYLGLFVLAVTAGGTMASGPDGGTWRTGLLIAVLLAGVISAGIVLMQWLWANPLVVFAQEAAPGDRPYASLGQPNHASTLLFLALCCALQLNRDRAVRPIGAVLATLLLTFAMVLTQSRTGIVQWLVLLLWCLWARDAAGNNRPWRWGVLVLALGITEWALMPWLQESLYLPGAARDLVNSDSSGRIALWRAFADAMVQRPWFGWGWLQSGWAQQAVAACHPGLLVYFGYTHLLPLDLMLWLGVPLGVVISGLLAWGLWPHLSRRGSGRAGYWLVAVLGIGVHAMLEYPLAYLYFLVPAGLMLGMMDALQPARSAVRLPRPAFLVSWVFLVSLSVVVLHDIVVASTAYTEVRFAEARIGSRRTPPPLPDMWVLDQLDAFVRLRATGSTQPVSDGVLHESRKVVLRQPILWVSVRYAQLLAVSGRHGEAAREQQRLCDINGPQQCALWSESWGEWRQAHALDVPEFSGAVLEPRCDGVSR